MEIDLVNIQRELITVSKKSIITLLGTSDNELDPHTGELIETYLNRCTAITNPLGGYARFKAIIPDSAEDIEIEGTRFKTGKIIRNMLRNATEYAFFVVTAGPGPEELSRSLIRDNQYLEGFIVDLIASGIVEAVANQVQAHVKSMAEASGMRITNRYSPGYCSWNVSEQQKLFRLLPSGCCGIVLSNSSLMTPIKSLSGIIGIGETVEYNEYTCEICSMRDCAFRSVVQHESGIL